MKKFLKLTLSMVIALCCIVQGVNLVQAQETYIVVDDQVVDQKAQHHFTYSSAMDVNGLSGWSSSDASFGTNELKTQHWVWNENNQEASKHYYEFTFVGTGVELVGITPTGSSLNTFKLDQEVEKTQSISTLATKAETVIYSRKNLAYGQHTVKVTLPNDGKQKGLQVSYARVFGTKTNQVEKLEIPHTKTSGSTNKFTFSQTGWTAGNQEHVWSDVPPVANPESIWYQVDFVGNKIEVYAGKNRPMGKVKYFIDNNEVGTYSLYNGSNINSTLIATFDNLGEGPHTFKAVATGQKDAQASNTLIDCAKVVVYHAPYVIEDIVLDSNSFTMVEGATQQINYHVLPDYASNVSLTYSTSNNQIVKVNQNGLIQALQAGDASVFVEAKAYNIRKEIKIHVEQAQASIGGSIVDVDTQYTQNRYDEVKQLGTIAKELNTWRNDQAISELAIISKNCSLDDVRVVVNDLVGEQGVIRKENVQATFIKSTKAYNGAYLGYGNPDRKLPVDNGSNRSESSDILYQTSPIKIGFNKVQPVWLSFDIPKDAKAGTYQTTIEVLAKGIQEPLQFTYTIHVQDAVLNDATAFKDHFDIELWQYPYAVAEYYGVEAFSKEHFDLLKSSMELYKRIGGHAITTTISEDAWAAQTYSANEIHYPSMIKWEKVNGKMTYDFTNFDKWVQFNKDLGIGDKIVLYSIAPWHNSFTYWENGKLIKESFKVGGGYSANYRPMWSDFLRHLIDHLMEKGWFDDAYIGIDERGFSKAAFDLIDSVRNIHDIPLKTAGAMDGFVDKRELALRVSDLNVGDTAAQAHPVEFAKLVKDRKALGYRTTLYSCTEHQPGNFSLSAPVESYWSIINAGAATEGFLRWAYDAWVQDPLHDATHNAFEPGDCFLVYPDKKDAQNPTVKSSIRLERMAQGVRDVNKLKQMVAEIPALQADVDAMYAKLATTAKTSRSYLTKNQVEALAQEMNIFQSDLVKLTEKYLDLKINGTNNIDKITISEQNIQIPLQGAKQLHVVFTPTNVLNTAITWTSDHEDIVSVDANGVIHAHKLGSANIIATSKQDPTKIATAKVSVTLPEIEESAKVAYYSFDDENAKDAWGNRDGVVNQATFANGKSQKALLIQNENQNVTFTKDIGIGENDAYSISYWVKPTLNLDQRVSVMMDKNKDYSFDLKLASNRSAGYHVGKNSGDVLTFTYTFNKDTWYHITWTQSKTAGLSMYVNGQLIDNNAWTKTHKALLPFDIIGGTGFKGYIDEIKLYNRVLSKSEISSNMFVSGLNLNEHEKTLYINDTYKIATNLISNHEDKTITYKSTNPAVASVDAQGNVHAHKKGIAKIIVENKAGGFSEEVVISVIKKLNISSKIPMYQLPSKYLSDIEKAPNSDRQYLGQPDMIQTKTGRLITAYPKGHGKGPIIMQVSDDQGTTWQEKTDLPKSWIGSQETPTLYVLPLANGVERLMMITACPGWGVDSDGNRYGWNTSYSDDNGETWSEYKHWYSKRKVDNANNDAIVAMASLVQLKDEKGNNLQKWMGVYHNYAYVNFKTYLTFDEHGNEQWSEPEPYLSEYRSIEAKYQMCEIGMLRSPDGKRIVGLARSQSHNNPATLIYSDDEGTTWSKPMDLPGSLAGERHKAVYDPISNRLVISFREIKYDLNNNNQFDGNSDWICGDWVAWVGTYEDLMEQNEGQYRILLAEDFANNAKSGDTGYAGVVVLNDGTLIMDSYGHWDKAFSQSWPNGVTTDLCYIKQAKFKLGEIDQANGLVDKSALQAKVNEVKDVNKDAYTENTFKVFAQALKHAKAILESTSSQQIEVDDALKQLTNAYTGLKEQVDKSKLQALYNSLNSLKQEEYTTSSWQQLETVKKEVEQVLSDTNVTKAEVDAVKTKLETAISSLEKVEKPGTPLIPLEPSKPVEKPGTPLIPLEPSKPVEKPGTPLIPLEPSKPVEKPGIKPEANPNIDGTNTGDVSNLAGFVSVASLAACGIIISMKKRKCVK